MTQLKLNFPVSVIVAVNVLIPFQLQLLRIT